MDFPWPRHVSHMKQYIQYVYVYDVFPVFQWLYLFYTVHSCYNVLCTPTVKGQLWFVSEESFEIMGCPSVALDAWHSWSVSTCCSIYSFSCAAERVLQHHMTLLFNFLAEPENLCLTSAEQNIVGMKCHKCNIDCHIARLCSPPPPSTISADTHPSSRQLPAQRDSELAHPPSYNARIMPSYITVMEQILCISHSAICVVVCDAAVPSVVKAL